jgi:hypothetical protein
MCAARQLQKAPPGFAWLCIIIGVFPLLISLGVIDPDRTGVHAPMWVLALSGMVFVIAGLMMLVGRNSRFNNLLAALLCMNFGTLGAWVALFAPAEGFSGGIPLLSDSFNLALGRWVFGIGAALCFLVAFIALRQFFRHRLQ